MSTFMKKFKTVHPEHVSLEAHINLADKVAQVTKLPSFLRNAQTQLDLVSTGHQSSAEAYIEELIGKRAPLTQVLRMMGLMSIVGGGIKQKQFDFLRSEIVQAYGFTTLLGLDNLNRAGIIIKRENRYSFSPICTAYDLIGQPVSAGSSISLPASMHFAYHGYAPLSVRLVEASIRSGWTTEPGKAKLGLVSGQSFSKNVRPGNNASQSKKRIVLVFFIGGITFAEISALRWLNKREDHDREYIIMTTHITNGHKMISAILGNCENRYEK
uniref:Uncharacterized protein n=1 Tax=Spongospora subterranea TaxID=70186 RepID=A0A0H5R7R2_9EUKA|eukprot:CRZ10168.1 hypothetical protein [Spongospora subterranea]